MLTDEQKKAAREAWNVAWHGAEGREWGMAPGVESTAYAVYAAGMREGMKAAAKD